MKSKNIFVPPGPPAEAPRVHVLQALCFDCRPPAKAHRGEAQEGGGEPGVRGGHRGGGHGRHGECFEKFQK